MEFKHIPIMADDVIKQLNIRSDGIYVDGTLGGGGHSSLILEKLDARGQLIGIDQDEDAIKAATHRLNASRIIRFRDDLIQEEDQTDSDERVTIVKSNYSNIKNIFRILGLEGVDGILLDLGVSSYQFDEAERGFSYREDAPLDMRMDREQPLTAKEIINTYTEEDLAKIFFEYGEEKYSRSIAKKIIKARQSKEINSTGELVDIIRSSMPEREKNKKGHPAKRVFQALRIEVNHELDVLSDTIDDMIDLLNNDGRLCIITFHSLEDRIVKNKFKTAENPCICPPDFPVCTCGRIPLGNVASRKPIVAGAEELIHNPRSHSAKLRVFIRNNKTL